MLGNEKKCVVWWQSTVTYLGFSAGRFCIKKVFAEMFLRKRIVQRYVFSRTASASCWIFILKNRPKQPALRSSNSDVDQKGGDVGNTSNLPAFLWSLCCAQSVTCNDWSWTASLSACFVSHVLSNFTTHPSGFLQSEGFISFVSTAVHTWEVDAQGKGPANV